MTCPNCGTDIVEGKKFCGKCGAAARAVASAIASLEPSPYRCSTCASEVSPGKKFCGTCGSPVKSQTPPPPQSITKPPLPVPSRSATALALEALPPTPRPVPPPQPSLAASVARAETPARATPPVAATPRLPAVTPPRGPRRQPLIYTLVAVLLLSGGGFAWIFIQAHHHGRTLGEEWQTVIGREPQAVTSAPSVQTQSNPASTESSTATGAAQETQPQAPPVATAVAEPPSQAAPLSQGTQPRRTPQPAVAVPRPKPFESAHQAADQAFYAARYIDPPEDSALFWARKAQALGDPDAAQMEQQVLDKMTASVGASRQARNYDQALALLARLIGLFPDRPQLQQLQTDIQQEQQQYARQMEEQHRQAAIDAQTRRFEFRHRHISLFGPGSDATYFCSGTLTVLPDGTVNYDCSQTGDPSGRCDHVSFAPGTLKQVKIGLDGTLHLASRNHGNFDFEGARTNVQQALAAIMPLVKK